MFDINAALGCTDRPLQVGDWVELVDPQPHSNVHSLTFTRELREMDWPQQVLAVKTSKSTCGDNVLVSGAKIEAMADRFRRVPPPASETSEVEQLREQVLDLTHERDRYKQAFVKALACVDQAFQPDGKPEAILPDFCRLGDDKFEAVPRLAREHKQLSSKLSTVTAERDSLAAKLAEVEQERDEARESAKRAEADAAAMRELADDAYKLTTVYPRPYNNAGYELSNQITLACDKVRKGTAGRDLLDRHAKEIAAKDAEIETLKRHWIEDDRDLNELIEENERLKEAITELSQDAEGMRRLFEWAQTSPMPSASEFFEPGTKASDYAKRLEQIFKKTKRRAKKCRTAKAALVEHYRGKIDPAWFGEVEYRVRGDGCRYRRNGLAAQLWVANSWWDSSIEYKSWAELLASGETVPCTADGKPIVKGPSREWLEKMADAEDQCESVTAISPELLEAVECEHDTSGNPCPCNPVVEDYSKCQSCGVAWHDHLGITGVCKQLQECKAKAAMLDELREWIKNATFGLVGKSIVIGCQCEPVKFAELLQSIRDRKDGE